MGTEAIEPQDTDKDELTLALESSEKDDSQKAGDAAPKDEGAKTDEEKEAEAAEAAEAERKKPQEIEESGMTRLETAEEVEARIKAEDAAAGEEPTEVGLLREEVRDLRQMLRTSKRELTQTQAKFTRLSTKPAKSEEEEGEEEGEEGKKKQPLSKVEELQEAIAEIGTVRGANLDILLETMEQGRFSDVKEVCSRANFDDIFEAIASEVVKEKGGNLDEALLDVEYNVWNRANPYSYMYDLIKKYHPTYVKVEAEAKGEGEKDKGKKKEPAKAPGSIGNLGGDSSAKGGWTTAKIDALPEEELDTVPKEIYDKYFRGELD